MRYTIKNYGVVNRCVYNLFIIVVKLWDHLMLHWPKSNRPNSKHETLYRIGLILGHYCRRWANTATVADPGGGCAAGAPLPLFLGKYFKKSPELAEMYKKKLGARHQNPGRPPFFKSWIRHCYHWINVSC